MEELSKISLNAPELRPVEAAKTREEDTRHAEAAEKTVTETKGKSGNDWKKLLKELEIYALEYKFRLKFEVDKVTGRTVIQVINPETEKVIREIPPEETLKVAAFLKQQASQIIDTEA